ncbi:hypothetical protein CBA19CS91_35950 [Paraburkholderia hospita]|nr:hypothetical protein CBA19CS91_35950 [Paraburkholderia hospita]
MGQAKQRGSREQRIASAVPKAAKLTADERRIEQAKLVARALDRIMTPILSAAHR